MAIRRRREKEKAGGNRLTPEEIDDLTERAGDLLDELHSVLGEMSDRLIELAAGEK
jgi:hypothetical protein